MTDKHLDWLSRRKFLKITVPALGGTILTMSGCKPSEISPSPTAEAGNNLDDLQIIELAEKKLAREKDFKERIEMMTPEERVSLESDWLGNFPSPTISPDVTKHDATKLIKEWLVDVLLPKMAAETRIPHFQNAAEAINNPHTGIVLEVDSFSELQNQTFNKLEISETSKRAYALYKYKDGKHFIVFNSDYFREGVANQITHGVQAALIVDHEYQHALYEATVRRTFGEIYPNPIPERKDGFELTLSTSPYHKERYAYWQMATSAGFIVEATGRQSNLMPKGVVDLINRRREIVDTNSGTADVLPWRQEQWAEVINPIVSQGLY